MSSDNLRARAQGYRDEMPESWRPGEGEVLVGTVEGYERVETNFGPCATARVRDEEDGTLWTIWLSPVALVAEFQRVRPAIGERIAVRRLSDGCNSGGTAFKRFRLFVEREETGLEVLDQAAAEMGLDDARTDRPELFTRDDQDREPAEDMGALAGPDIPF